MSGFVDERALGSIVSFNNTRSSLSIVELALFGEFDQSTTLLFSVFPPYEKS